MGSLFGKKKPKTAAAPTKSERPLTTEEVAQVQQTVGQPQPGTSIVNKPRRRSRSALGIDRLGGAG